jgi:hypothetical protein
MELFVEVGAWLLSLAAAWAAVRAFIVRSQALLAAV